MAFVLVFLLCTVPKSLGQFRPERSYLDLDSMECAVGLALLERKRKKRGNAGSSRLFPTKIRNETKIQYSKPFKRPF
jgi:hypothetical protein